MGVVLLTLVCVDSRELDLAHSPSRAVEAGAQQQQLAHVGGEDGEAAGRVPYPQQHTTQQQQRACLVGVRVGVGVGARVRP